MWVCSMYILHTTYGVEDIIYRGWMDGWMVGGGGYGTVVEVVGIAC